MDADCGCCGSMSMIDGRDWERMSHRQGEHVIAAKSSCDFGKGYLWVRFSSLKNCPVSNIHLSFDLPVFHPYAGKNFEP